jgi:thymidylate synthase
MKQYLDLLRDIKENGVLQENRTGTDSISVFGRQIRFNLEDGFPLLTTKKLHTKSIIYELLWFLGIHMKDERYKDLPLTNIKYLKDNGVSIWDEWADKDGNLGKIYGYQWTNWDKYKYVKTFGSSDYDIKNSPINQIDNIIDQLKNNPNSRRIIVSAWNPGQLDEMNLPPCHYGFQCDSVKMKDSERYMKWIEYQKIHRLEDTGMSAEAAMDHYNFPTRKLSLMWNQRSCDTFLGIPYNIASYAFLTHMLAMVTNHIPYEVIGNLGNTHLYMNHMEYVNKQLEREIKQLPTLKINRKVTDIYDFKFEDFEIIDYDPYPNWKNVPIAV